MFYEKYVWTLKKIKWYDHIQKISDSLIIHFLTRISFILITVAFSCYWNFSDYFSMVISKHSESEIRYKFPERLEIAYVFPQDVWFSSQLLCSLIGKVIVKARHAFHRKRDASLKFACNFFIRSDLYNILMIIEW